jgi:hypothetical protein
LGASQRFSNLIFRGALEIVNIFGLFLKYNFFQHFQNYESAA